MNLGSLFGGFTQSGGQGGFFNKSQENKTESFSETVGAQDRSIAAGSGSTIVVQTLDAGAIDAAMHLAEQSVNKQTELVGDTLKANSDLARQFGSNLTDVANRAQDNVLSVANRAQDNTMQLADRFASNLSTVVNTSEQGLQTLALRNTASEATNITDLVKYAIIAVALVLGLAAFKQGRA